MEKSEQMESDHRHAGYKPAALPLSYVPLQGGRPCQSISEKPPAFMPLASIVFYNDFSDLSDLFLFYITFFKIFVTNM